MKMLNKNFNIIKCKSKKDLEHAVNFLKRKRARYFFNTYPDIKYLLWKYRPNFFKNKKIWLWLIKNKSRIEGTWGYMPVKLCTPKGIMRAMWGADFIIDNYYQSYPFLFSHAAFIVGRKLTSKSKITIALTFSQSKKLCQCLKLVGWMPLPAQVFFIKIKNNLNYNFNTKSLKINKVDYFNNEIDDFFKRVSAQYDFIIERNKRYLNWRYCLHPLHKYIILTASDTGTKRILGYIVFRIENKTKTGFILDILGNFDSSYCIPLLVCKALQFFQKEKAKIAYCLLSDKKYIDIFKKLNFQSYLNGDCFVRSENTNLPDKMLQLKSWHITMGDGDFWGAK